MAIRVIKRQLSPQEAAKTKPRILNPNGTYSSERSITIGVDRGFINIPTIWKGKQLSHSEAIKRSKKSRIRYPRFKTLNEAVRAAGQRSKDLGQAARELLAK